MCRFLKIWSVSSGSVAACAFSVKVAAPSAATAPRNPRREIVAVSFSGFALESSLVSGCFSDLVGSSDSGGSASGSSVGWRGPSNRRDMT